MRRVNRPSATESMVQLASPSPPKVPGLTSSVTSLQTTRWGSFARRSPFAGYGVWGRAGSATPLIPPARTTGI
eukprot:11201010-Lingulodinium_polyedra.AAC.1